MSSRAEGDFDCVECGEHRPTVSYTNRRQLEERKMCFACSHWTDKLDRLQEPNVFVIDGRWYTDGGARRGSLTNSFLGFGGREFEIHAMDGRVIRTNNLWHGGEIPEHFRDRIPDNAAFDRPRKWVDCGLAGKALE